MTSDVRKALDEVYEEVVAELDKAMEKHPYWPAGDLSRQALIVLEEAGELGQACLAWVEESEQLRAPARSFITLQSNIVKEARQTAAMALRFLLCAKGKTC